MAQRGTYASETDEKPASPHVEARLRSVAPLFGTPRAPTPERPGRERHARTARPGWRPFLGRVGLRNIAVFAWQLHTMANAGIALTRALASIAVQTNHPRLREAIETVIEAVNSGRTFADGLRLRPKVFSPLFVHMVEVGETGGKLDAILKDLAEYYDAQLERRSGILSAVSYPALVMTACVGVVIFLITFLLPRLFRLFDNMGAAMPPPTLILLRISTFLRTHGLLIVGGLLGLIVLLVLYARTPQGRLHRDTLLIRLPIIGSLYAKVVLARFAHTLSIMLNSGVPILNALKTARDTMQNAAYARTIDRLVETVSEGGQVHAGLQRDRTVPDIIVQMVAVGEETGQLGTMLAKVSAYYEKEVASAVKTLTRVLEPVLLVVMAFVVGFIAVSVLDPITDLIVSINK